MAKPQNLHFITHADLKNIIGQDLINDDNIAVVELVKNGIDAGANLVSIHFAASGASVIVEDDGSGMSMLDIKNKWLNIAYSEKKHSVMGDRVLAGNKGVGRFACDRLGRKLDMFTRRSGGPLLHLTVDWTAFENKVRLESTIQKVNITVAEVSDQDAEAFLGRNAPEVGTMLAITDLRQEWSREKLTLLKRNLERFVNPIAVFDKGSVKIKLVAEAESRQDGKEALHNQINGIIENKIFTKLKFNTTYIESRIDPLGETITTEMFHDGNRIYRLVEKNLDLNKLKNIHVVLHYMNPYKKAYFKRQTGLNLVEFGAVFLFVNGYRVPPYGDRNNDWLQLDVRKSQGTTRYLANRELLGLINVKDTDNSFRIVSNREGVVRDQSFIQLARGSNSFFIQLLTKLERFVVDGLDWDSVPEPIRVKLRTGVIPGDQEMPESEVYKESGDSKRRRIALDVLRIVGATPARTLELEISPDVLDALSREREEEVSHILDKFNSFDGNVGQNVKLALNRIQSEFNRQKSELQKARKDVDRKTKQVERLTSAAKNIAQAKKNLQSQVATQQSEILFSRLMAGTDHEQLLLLHHQSKICGHSLKGFLDQALTQLKEGTNVGKASELIEKALNVTRKIIAITNFATKANFRLKTETITADLATFIQEYLLNVAQDTSAQNLRVAVTRDFLEQFEMRFKPIDIAIVFDNLASNSARARAKRFDVHLSHPSENELLIDITDDGPGLSKEVQPPDKIFERGVTTTNGSGLGLYHVKQTVVQLNGDISLRRGAEKGFALRIRLTK
ncbi:MAG: ATP-binding protein [Desulfobacteraceae bacterium]|nr:ATP-binding protein [Desulfobacteraceae bacterium]